MLFDVRKPLSSRGAIGTDVNSQPVRLEVEGHSLAVRKLSEDGRVLVDFHGRAEVGQILPSTMIVNCDGFELSVDVMWEVISVFEEPAQMGLQLAPVNDASNLATVNTLIKALVSGEVLHAGQILEICGKADDIRMAAAAAGGTGEKSGSALGRPWQRRVGATIFLTLAAVLLAFIGANFATRAFIVEADGMIVNPQSVIARMPQSGELVSYSAPVGARVPPDSPVAIAKTPAGEVRMITSTCECVVGGHLASGRAFLGKGNPVAQLVPVNGANKALISVKLEELRRIRVGDQVTLSFYDSDAKVAGTVERVSPPKIIGAVAPRTSNLRGTLEVRSSTTLPPWRIGEPVIATVLLSRFNPFA